MTNETNEGARLQQLEAMLDTYGADRTRWPVQRRHELSQFIAASPAAQVMMREAAVFDHLLDEAPTLDAGRRSALFDSIIIKVEHAPRVVIENAPLAKKAVTQPRAWRWGGTGAALAASLMLGVIAGQAGSLRSFADELVAIAGLDTGAPSQQMAQTDDAGGYFEEDLL